MPGTGAIRWGDISFRTRPRPPTEPPILTRRTRRQRPDTTGVEGTGGTGGHGPRCRWAAGPGHTHARPETTAGPAGQQESGCGARGRRRGLAGQRDDAFNHTSASQAPLVWRAPEGPEGTGRGAGGRWRGLAAVPVGGGGAWPGFETTRRAKLAARTARGRAAAHGHTKQPGLTKHTQRPEHQRRNKHRHRKRKAYNPRNALIAGISRTACTRPAR